MEARRVVVLAEPRRGVAVLAQDAADRGVLRTDIRVVARVAGRQLRDHAEADLVVVAAGDQRGARGRAERGGVELGVAQPGVRDAVQRRRRDDAAERAADAVALVVGHDQQHVGRALRRHDARRPPGLGVLGAFLDHAAERRRGGRQVAAVDGDGGTRAARHAVDHALRRRGWGRAAGLRLRLARQKRAAERGGKRRLCRRDEQLPPVHDDVPRSVAQVARCMQRKPT